MITFNRYRETTKDFTKLTSKDNATIVTKSFALESDLHHQGMQNIQLVNEISGPGP